RSPGVARAVEGAALARDRQGALPGHYEGFLGVAWTICTAGEPLSAKGTALLRIFGIKMARFQLILDSYYHDGEMEVISEPDEDELEGEEIMEEELF
ncbi:hypothetical protein CYMTET_45341, partial [Cymbomonas tetramitiformis]